MEYFTHNDFMHSVYYMYRRSSVYKKNAERVLSVWAKAQHQNIFRREEILSMRSTSNGEKRIQHCRKYSLSVGCRLITACDDEKHIFLFLGTHEECDRWLENNRGIDFISRLRNNPINVNTEKIKDNRSSRELNDNWNKSNELSQLRVDIEEYASVLGHANNMVYYKESDFLHVAEDTFLKDDFTYINSIVDLISSNVKRHQTHSALEKIKNLNDYLLFVSLKMEYLNRLMPDVGHTIN